MAAEIPPIVETDKVRFWMHEGIIYTVSLPDTDQKHDLVDAKAFISALGKLAGESRVPILVDMTEVRSVTREARLYFAGEKAVRVARAVAIVVKSSVSRMIGNFFLGFAKPSFPTRLFTSEDKALHWLRSFLA